MKKSVLLIALLIFGALPVFAQTQGPTKNVWDYIVDGYNGLAMTFDDMSTNGLESVKFLMFIRVLLLIAVFTLFFHLIGKYVFKESKDKNKNIVIALALAIISVVAMPNAALVGIASLYSGALVFVLVGALVIGAMYWTLYGLKGETRGTYFTKALMFAVLMWITSAYSNAAYFISQPPSMLFTNLGVFLSLVFTVLMLWFAVKAILMPAGGVDVHETISSAKRTYAHLSPTPQGQQPVAILSTAQLDRVVRDVRKNETSLRSQKLSEVRSAPSALIHSLDEMNNVVATMLGQKTEQTFVAEGQQIMNSIDSAQTKLNLLEGHVAVSSARALSALRQETVQGSNQTVQDMMVAVRADVTTILSRAGTFKALAQR